jgi:hypothetical protein
MSAVWLIGGCDMAVDKGAALAPRSRSAPKVVAPRNKVNVALPFSRITAEDPVKMKAGDWISLAGLVIAAAGFSVVIWQLARSARAPEAG